MLATLAARLSWQMEDHFVDKLISAPGTLTEAPQERERITVTRVIDKPKWWGSLSSNLSIVTMPNPASIF